MSTTLPGLNSSAQELCATVVSQDVVADETYRLRLECPELAANIRPGQFFMVRSTDGSDPLLGRPFALYDVYVDESGQPAGVDFGYHTVGKLTGRMPNWSMGHPVSVWGPLGNGFPELSVEKLLFVAGGIGYTPAIAVMRQALGVRGYAGAQPSRKVDAVEMIYGARTKSLVADCSDFASTSGFQLTVATDDGSVGHAGFVTDLLAERIASSETHPDAVFTCGPGVMMKRVAEQCLEADVPCWLSLESPMACGFGACFSCVAKVHTEDGWDYRRTCVEGPIFRAEELLLDELNC